MDACMHTHFYFSMIHITSASISILKITWKGKNNYNYKTLKSGCIR